MVKKSKPLLSTFMIFTTLVVVMQLSMPSSRSNAQNSASAPSSTAVAYAAGTVLKDQHGFDMNYVPSGNFEMGISYETFLQVCKAQFNFDKDTCLKDIGNLGAFDPYTAKITAFWIDRYEVTIQQYQLFQAVCVDAGLCQKINLTSFPELTDNPQKPQVGVTWFDAMLFCNQRGARLPTEEEWEYAASGPQKWVFPWGDQLIRDNAPLFKSTWPVGSIPANVSWIGAFDMVGDATQWVEDRFKPYPGSTQNWTENDTIDVSRVVRGGSWDSGYSTLTTFRRDYRNPSDQDKTVGFRCARSSIPLNP